MIPISFLFYYKTDERIIRIEYGIFLWPLYTRYVNLCVYLSCNNTMLYWTRQKTSIECVRRRKLYSGPFLLPNFGPFIFLCLCVALIHYYWECRKARYMEDSHVGWSNILKKRFCYCEIFSLQYLDLEGEYIFSYTYNWSLTFSKELVLRLFFRWYRS